MYNHFVKIIFFLFISFFNQSLFAADQQLNFVDIKHEQTQPQKRCLECELYNINISLLPYKNQRLPENLVVKIYEYIRIKYPEINTLDENVIKILFDFFKLAREQVVQFGDYACGINMHNTIFIK